MNGVSADTLSLLLADFDAREEVLRRVVAERLAVRPVPVADDAVVASYFFAFRTQTLSQAVKEIAYHATSGIKHPPPGSLLEQCTATVVGLDAFDASERVGLLHLAFPLKMLLHPDGHLTSTDLLHTVAGAIIFDVCENLDARLIGLTLPERVIRTFPGPAHGPAGLRQLGGFGPEQPAFGTILKPTAGLVPEQVGTLVEGAARCPLFLFVKEDENLYPNLDYCPLATRVRLAAEGIRRALDRRGGSGPIFAPHITGSPAEIVESLHAAVDAGATAVMFSETYANGTVRLVRDAARRYPVPPAIYGHNAGIGSRTRAIWREVLDLLARLDGIDFRQTAPVKPGAPFLKPHGREWEASEDTLSRPLPGIRPTMIVRAGGLDQGCIGLNLADTERRGITGNVLFLAGSAINSIRDASGRTNPAFGAEAMVQALGVHRSRELADVPAAEHLRALFAVAERQRLAALCEALRQRYPDFHP